MAAVPAEVLDPRDGVEEPAGPTALLPGVLHPVVHGDVVGMERLTVGAEGQDGVRLHLVDQPADPRHALGRALVQAAVRQVVDPVLVDAQHRHRGRRLETADGAEAIRRPQVGVLGPALARGRRRTHDPLALPAGLGHGGAGQVGLVVGVGPDREDRPELVRGGHGHGVTLRSWPPAPLPCAVAPREPLTAGRQHTGATSPP
jgi:hypothetical protein